MREEGYVRGFNTASAAVGRAAGADLPGEASCTVQEIAHRALRGRM